MAENLAAEPVPHNKKHAIARKLTGNSTRAHPLHVLPVAALAAMPLSATLSAPGIRATAGRRKKAWRQHT